MSIVLFFFENFCNGTEKHLFYLLLIKLTFQTFDTHSQLRKWDNKFLIYFVAVPCKSYSSQSSKMGKCILSCMHIVFKDLKAVYIHKFLADVCLSCAL